MNSISDLLKSNACWAVELQKKNPTLFGELAKQQNPKYLWIGCSDSRVPETLLVGMQAGDVFVHRNIANVVGHDDPCCQSVIQYAVGQLKVPDILVCGHYGCGGVMAAVAGGTSGPIDQWLEPIRYIAKRHEPELAGIADQTSRINRLCELNVLHQVLQVCDSQAVQAAWQSGQPLAIHGLIYRLTDGHLQGLSLDVSSIEEAAKLRADQNL